MTSLQQQLKSLKVHSKQKPSLIFEKREAADIDKETVLGISLKAFEQLCLLGDFEEFRGLYVIVDRTLLNIEENKNLDIELEKFLRKLSPFFLTPIVMHCLEYLVRGYQIHELNVVSCLHMILPYHETDEYQKVLSILQLGDYEFLKKNKIMDLGLEFVNKMYRKSNGIKNAALSSFYASFLIRYFNLKATDNDIRIIYPEFIHGLESKDKDLNSTMLMLFAFLSKKIQFEKEILDQLVEALAGGLKYHLELSIMCLITVCASQKVEFSLEFYSKLVQTSKFGAIVSVCENYECEEFLVAFLKGCVKHISTVDVKELTLLLISQSFISASVLETVLLSAFALLDSSDDLVSVLKHVQQTRIHDLDKAIHTYQKTLTKKEKKKFTGLLNTIFGSSLLETLADVNVTLFLGLQHPEVQIRLLALQRLSEILKGDVESQAVSFAGPIVVQRLQDSDREVELVLSMIGLVDLVDATELVHGLSSVVLNTADESIRMKAVYLILEVLKKKSLSVTQQVEDTLLGSLLGITSLPNSHTLVNNVLGKLNLGNAKKIEDETGQKYSWLFVNSIVDGVTAHARANPSVVARILKGLDSKTKSMRVFSGLVLMKMMHDQLLSVHQYKTVVKFVKEYVSTNDIELDHVDVKKHHSHPPIVFGSWYVNSEFEKLEMTGVMLLLLSVIDHYKPAEKNYYISTDQVLYNEIIEVILYTGRAKDVLKRFLEKQIGERVLEFGFGGLESSVVVLSTTLGIACKYIQANAKSTNPKDLQVVLAPLLVCLTHAEKSVRAIAVGVLAALKNSLEAYAKINGKVSKSSIYGYGTFFGSKSKEMEFLGSKTSVEFVDAVLERGHDIIADADHLKLNFKLVLKKLNQKIRDEIISFLATNVMVMQDQKSKIKLLSVLATVDSPVKIRVLGKTILPELAAFDQDLVDVRLVTSLIECFAISDINSVFLKQSGNLFELFIQLLGHYETRAEVVGCCSAVSVISHHWFSSLDLSLKQRIFAVLIDTMANGPVQVKEIIQIVMQDISVAAEIVDPKLSEIISLLQGSDVKRVKSDVETEQSKIQVLVAFLEFLQSIPADGLLDLVPRIVLVLDGLLNFPLESYTNVEYCKQLVLSVLETIIKSCPEASEMAEESFRVDSIVQCIRITDNPTTHNAALLLLSAIGSIHSEVVLMNIMPVFTFMGANILRQDDNYSFHVVQKTLETIIPSLIQGDEDPLVYVKKVLEVFVNALEHVPSHRRLKLFTILAKIIGTEKYLGVLLILLIAKPTILGEKSSTTDTVNVKKFAMQLLFQFDHATQLQVLACLMDQVHLIPDEPAVQPVPALVDTSTLKTRSIRLIKLHVLQYVNQFLKSMQATTAEKEQCVSLYMQLLQSQLLAISTFTKNSSDGAWNKYASLLATILYNNLDCINAMISLSLFVDVMNTLIVHKNSVIQQRALTMLQERVKVIQTVDFDVEIFDPVFKTLSDLVQQDSGKQPLENKQQVLLSIAALTQLLGESKIQEYASVLQLVVDHGLKVSNVAVSSTSMITVSVLVRVMKARAVPYLNKVMPVILETMKKVTESEEIVVVYNCAITSMLSMVETIPQFLSSYLGPFVGLLCDDKALAEDEELEKNSFQVISLMCKQIEPRVLIPCFLKKTVDMVSTGQESLLRMFGYVTELVSHSLQSNLVDYQKEWINLFIELFSIKPINTLEGPLIQLFIKYTLKLNEKTFKPLFIKMFDWSQDEDRGDVLLFFKLVLGLVNNLKSIFVPYFGIFIDNALEIVVKGRNDLWKIVIECFLKCFTFDTTGFINEERFEKVLPPLIGLLDSDSDAEEYKEDMEQVIATMGVLAKACHVESAWKKLNKQALLQTRSDNANVRWAGLKVVHELYRVLGEEMLVFFPETIPFLAEVMDDDDPEVEMACQDLCMQIQTFLGEPIQQYFSTS